MSDCPQEMCRNWTGQGCACDVMGIEPDIVYDGDQFCPLCDVSMSLHDGPDTCLSAEIKAGLLTQFGWTVR